MSCTEKVHKGFRLVEFKNDKPHTLFHGINKSRVLRVGEWLEADVKRVNDNGGQSYMGGFHFLYNLHEIREYMERFTAPRDLRVVRMLAKDVWPKPTNRSVFLSRWMFLEDDYQRLSI